MSYLYDPMNRRRPAARTPQQPSAQQLPTLDDFNRLVQAYNELHARSEAQTKELSAKTSELAIKSDALHRQSEDLKKTQTEQLWLRAALEQMQHELNEAKQQDWQDRYERLQAEVDTLRRRWEQRFVDETDEARRNILRDMLPLADHLELALQHAQALDGDALSNFVGNLETTRRAFLDTLRRYGVTQQDALARPFDPALHEAIGQVVTSDLPVDHVAQVVQSGYMEGDKLLRPARVIVNVANVGDERLTGDR